MYENFRIRFVRGDSKSLNKQLFHIYFAKYETIVKMWHKSRVFAFIKIALDFLKLLWYMFVLHERGATYENDRRFIFR